ncbi:SIP domain-containing protein [Pseudonocardia aurantiaca]|uniref:SIP domain-containing protein n=1 Tax=Pseudonocardia aurantiaca TaxID=75290 RepID=A0ABW4FUY1_9PSEU
MRCPASPTPVPPRCWRTWPKPSRARGRSADGRGCRHHRRAVPPLRDPLDRAGHTPPGSDRLVSTVRIARLPVDTTYAWVAGESATVRAVRRHLLGERGLDRRHVTFSGYWRRGA